jgi:DNA-binding LytR/AlgR family response regulator
MDNVHVLILEDNPAEANALVSVLTANNYTIVGVASTAAAALTLFYQQKVDVVIIDIFLGGSPEGISFAETINIVPNAAKPFVFLTNSNDRSIFERARLTHPFSYLIKPFNELEILYAIEMAVEKFYAQTGVFSSSEADTVVGGNYLFIKKKDALKKVETASIVYIEVDQHYCNIVTEQEKFLILMSLAKIIELLDAKKFIRTHRNYLVNTEKITEIIPADNLVLLKGNHQAPLSDKYKEIIHRFVVLK